MKKSDITIGAEYAYAKSEFGSRERVRVIGEAKIEQGYGYRAKTITGSKVQVLDKVTGAEVEGRVYDVANRDLKEPWVEYAEREASLRRNRQATARRLHEDRDKRARVLLDLIPALRHVGVADSTTGIWTSDRDVIQYLELHMPETLGRRGEGVLAEVTFTAPYADSLVEYVKNGSPIKVPAVALLDIASRR